MKSNWTMRFIAALALLVIQPPWSARADGPPPTPPPPANVSSVGTIADASEPGTRLTFSGQVFAPDGVTPAVGVFVYAYQTDASGQYHNDPQTRVARLHGWAKTDAQGRFEFRTIHPGAYPGRQIAAHVHFHVWGGGYPLQWTPDLLFAGDPLLKPEQISESETAGKFGGVRAITTGADGVQHCTFNIRVNNVTNYPAGAASKP